MCVCVCLFVCFLSFRRHTHTHTHTHIFVFTPHNLSLPAHRSDSPLFILLPSLPLHTQANSGLDGEFPYPIIADQKRELAVKLGMLDPDEIGKDGMPLTARAVSLF